MLPAENLPTFLRGRPMNTSEVIVRYLAAAGIRHIFGYPGDPSVEFLEAARREGMEFILARREGTAGFMAEAYGQITGLPGVCLSTLGPGSSNLVNPVANAFLDRVPMIALSGQIESARQPFFTHQVLDHNRLFAPVAKWVTELRPNTVATVMRKALRVACAERPGPVHITTAADVVGAEASDDAILLPPMRPAAQAVQVLAVPGVEADPLRRLAQARRPVAIVGIGAQRAGVSAEIVRFAETVGCAVVSAPMAKGTIAEDHPYYAGTLDMACNGFMWEFLSAADLILAIGFDAVELIKPWRLKAPTLHIDAVANTDQVYPAEVEIIGDIGAVLVAVTTGYRGAPKWPEGEIRRHREALSALYYAGRVAGKLNPTDVVDVVRRAMPRETVVSTDVGSHKLLVGQGWTTYAPKGMLMTNGLSSMGYSLPAAMTAALLDRRRPVVCFVGDGGLAMVQGELRLAASLGLDNLTVVVFCDNSLNRIELKQMARQYPSWGTLIEPTDIAKLGAAMGCAAGEVRSAAELERLFATPRDGSGPLLVGAIIDPAQYAAQF
jgi:acetolactate synthase-1/2/3 large subunit